MNPLGLGSAINRWTLSGHGEEKENKSQRPWPSVPVPVIEKTKSLSVISSHNHAICNFPFKRHGLIVHP